MERRTHQGLTEPDVRASSDDAALQREGHAQLEAAFAAVTMRASRLRSAAAAASRPAMLLRQALCCISAAVLLVAVAASADDELLPWSSSRRPGGIDDAGHLVQLRAGAIARADTQQQHVTAAHDGPMASFAGEWASGRAPSKRHGKLLAPKRRGACTSHAVPLPAGELSVGLWVRAIDELRAGASPNDPLEPADEQQRDSPSSETLLTVRLVHDDISITAVRATALDAAAAAQEVRGSRSS